MHICTHTSPLKRNTYDYVLAYQALDRERDTLQAELDEFVEKKQRHSPKCHA
jgi:hypothetical protein